VDAYRGRGEAPGNFQQAGSGVRVAGVALGGLQIIMLISYVNLLVPMGWYDLLGWLLRLQVHIVPGFILWFISAYNYNMKPRHLWDSKGAENDKRGGGENGDEDEDEDEFSPLTPTSRKNAGGESGEAAFKF